ncbi:methylmalonyl-CoA mutase [Amycolatopsis arida]|uniref:Methylmalonyl-CoA mutase n=1 Tax=Amycolatopsis arida TaxID=587909 RepID=A0A1I5WR66_9PSEU|nr:methylmalonyl-CoA mutase [Amycolatopsis arida]SFQ22057.1 methylmalonyl-CoA mutase [Amycolatopsis arida]
MPEPVAGREPDELALAAEFDRPDREDWRKLVAGVLRKTGALPEGFTGPPESLLTSTTYDGIAVQPLYTAEDTEDTEDTVPPAGFPGLPPFVRGTRPEGAMRTGWDVRALHLDPDPAATNRAALADLAGGVRSLWLRVGAGALPPDALGDALHEVYVELAPVVLDAGADQPAAAEALLAVFAERGIPDSEVVGNVGADPIGLRARTGQATGGADAAAAAALAADLAGRYPNLRTMVVDALPYHEAGGADTQELGAAIATGVAYLRALTGAGLAVDDAAARLEFRLAATADQFLTIAKLRAARRLWARVTEVAGVSPAARGMRQHAVTSPAMLTRRDPWVNLLRGCVAGFAAGVGGADAVTVLPFDGAIGLPDAFSRRIARNTQAILLEESKLAGVIDPAGGSWYVERLTDEVARAAWREFTAIERDGGIEAVLESGTLAGRLAETWAARERRLATRADAITGVSEFPLLDEKPVRRPPLPPAVRAGGGLPRVRYAQEYERLRDRADAHLAAHGTRPRIFLATLGPVAAHTARATFAANLFTAGGVEPVNPGAGGSAEEVAAAFRDSGARIACLCGTDTAYREQGATVVDALRAAGAEAVYLAGKPADDLPAGLRFVHAGCDALAVLRETLDTLGVAP